MRTPQGHRLCPEKRIPVDYFSTGQQGRKYFDILALRDRADCKPNFRDGAKAASAAVSVARASACWG
jgi:hypothetical protein